MSQLYPSWIEIPADDLRRALAFYRAVFRLSDTPRYDEPPAQIAVLLPSDKQARAPGVSLVQSPTYTPSSQGLVINFHLGDHTALMTALQTVEAYGGQVQRAPVDTGEGVRYCTVRDCEGNTIALSSYEPVIAAQEPLTHQPRSYERRVSLRAR